MATSRARDSRQPDKESASPGPRAGEPVGSAGGSAAARGRVRVLPAWRATSKRLGGAQPPSHAPESWPGVVNPEALEACVELLLAQSAVVVPTETVYGLAACAGSARAVARIFEVKQRPADNPLIVHVASEAQLYEWAAELTPLGQKLAARFWPGPLTLVVAARAPRPWVTAGLDSVALRSPAHPFMRQAVLRAGPLAAPSANLSGRPSPTRAEHALEDLEGRVPLIVDGGELPIGLESTVLDVRGAQPVLLRPGAITAEQVAATCGQPLLRSGRESTARSPGMKYRHYSPSAELWLYPADWARARPLLERDIAELKREGKRVGSLCAEAMGVAEHRPLPSSAERAAAALFSRLREMDALGVDVIVAQNFEPSGIGAALADRLARAATRHRQGDSPRKGRG